MFHRIALDMDREIDPQTQGYVVRLTFREATPSELLDRVDLHNSARGDDLWVEGLSPGGSVVRQKVLKGVVPLTASGRALAALSQPPNMR